MLTSFTLLGNAIKVHFILKKLQNEPHAIGTDRLRKHLSIVRLHINFINKVQKNQTGSVAADSI